jgi:hypothetical protein
MTTYDQMTKQVIEFQKNSFSSIFDAMATLQDKTADAVDSALDQSSWLPEDGRKAIQGWVDVCQQERDRFKSFVDEGFDGLEKYLGSVKFTGTAKTGK